LPTAQFSFDQQRMARLKTSDKRISAPGRGETVETTCDFSVVIVNFNVRDFLRQALLSVQRALDGMTSEIIVVDNASEDGSVDMLLAEFPEVRVIENDANRGFAGANNQALRLARGRFLVLLNPDTVVQENTFAAVRDFFSSAAGREAGMVGCKILNPDGTLQLACRRSFPTPWVAFTRLSGLSRLFPRSRIFGKYNLTYLDENALTEVEAISGSFMALRREAFSEVGLLDETFFLYGEDLDWCFRLRDAGWKIYYLPQTQIIHFKGESAKRSNLDNLRIFYHAMHLFAQKHFRARLSTAFYGLLVAAIWFRGTLSAIRKAATMLFTPLIDFTLIQASLAFGIFVRFGDLHEARFFVVVDVIYTLVWMSCLAIVGCFGKHRYSPYQAFMAGLAGFLANASFTFFFNQYAFSRVVVLAAGAATIFSLSAWRLAAKILLWLGIGPFRSGEDKTLLGRRTVIVGDFATGESLLSKLASRVHGAYDLVGLVSLQETEVGRAYDGLPVLASLDHLDDIIKRRRIQEVIFSTHRLPFERMLGIIAKSREQRVNFKLASGNLEVIIGKTGIDQLQDVPLVDIEYRLQRRFFRVAKRTLDFAVALFLLILFTVPVLARWVFTSRRLQQRRAWIQKRGRGAVQISLWHLQPRTGSPASLDHLPWLLPVLSGAVSLVGSELDFGEEAPAVSEALTLPTGITGLVQLKSLAVLTREEKEKLHLFYVTHYSPVLDLEILFRALFRLR